VFLVGKGRAARSSSSPASSTTVEGIEESVGGDDDNGDCGTQDVLVIPFTPNVGESVGLIAEQKVSLVIVTLTITLQCGQSHSYVPFVENLVFSFMMKMESAYEMLSDINQSVHLSACKDFVEFCCHEIFKTYIMKFSLNHLLNY
jgi:hypothetical protein